MPLRYRMTPSCRSRHVALGKRYEFRRGQRESSVTFRRFALSQRCPLVKTNLDMRKGDVIHLMLISHAERQYLIYINPS